MIRKLGKQSVASHYQLQNFQMGSVLDNPSVMKLHGFADASELAYGAVKYLHSIKDNEVFVTVQLAKSKIALLKGYRISRLELSIALVLARLAHHFLKIVLDIIHFMHLWTDSQDMLW